LAKRLVSKPLAVSGELFFGDADVLLVNPEICASRFSAAWPSGGITYRPELKP